MKKIAFLLLIFIFSSGNLFSQIVFQKTIGIVGSGEWGKSVQQTNDNGYVICGSTSLFGSTDPYLLKTNANGSILWAKAFGVASKYEVGECVRQTSDSGYILVGWNQNTGIDSADIYLIKTDASGNLLWSKAIGGANHDLGYSVRETTDGGYIIAGVTSSFGAGSLDIYLIKTDNNGNLLWTKTFGGTDFDDVKGIEQTNDGGYIIAGTVFSFSSWLAEGLLFKIDNNGNLLWAKTYAISFVSIEIKDIKQTNDNGYILTGRSIDSTYGRSIYLLKTDSIGNVIWNKAYANNINGSDNCGYAIETTDDGFAITGGYEYNFSPGGGVLLLKTDTVGNVSFIKKYKSAVGYSIDKTTDNGFIITGVYDNTSDGDIYLIKTDSLGNSGCNQTSPFISANSPTVSMSSRVLQTFSGGVALSPLTVVNNGGPQSTLCFSGANIQEVNIAGSLTLSPNPTSGVFNLQCEAEIKEIEIYNCLGQKVNWSLVTGHSQQITNDLMTIDLSTQPKGIYFIRAQTESGTVTGKVVIE